MDKRFPTPLPHTQRVFFLVLMVVCVVTLTLGLKAYRQAVEVTTKAVECPWVHVPGVPLDDGDPTMPNAVVWRARTLLTLRLLLGSSVLGVVLLLGGFRYVWTLRTDRAVMVLGGGMLILCTLTTVTVRNTPPPHPISCSTVIDIN
jgi:hypothetical protein